MEVGRKEFSEAVTWAKLSGSWGWSAERAGQNQEAHQLHP